MQLPIDVKALLDEAVNIDEAAATPLSVTLYVDATAPQDVRAFADAAFATASAHARVVRSDLSTALQAPFPGDDAAIVVAGLDERAGAAAAALRAVGVPAMVVTTLPSLVAEIAQASGRAVPEGDLVGPGVVAPALLDRVSALVKGAPAPAVSYDAANEPIALDEEGAAALGERMGAWMVAACRDKRLACALAFPFVRKPLAQDAVQATAVQNAGVGLVAFIPGADLPVMTLNQAKMLLQIAAAYGQPMNMARVKELACVVGGAFACRSAARQLVAAVPGLGWAAKAAVGYAGTLAMGRAAIEYFEAGGNVAGLASVAQRARDAAASAAGAVRAAQTASRDLV